MDQKSEKSYLNWLQELIEKHAKQDERDKEEDVTRCYRCGYELPYPLRGGRMPELCRSCWNITHAPGQ